MAWNGSDQTGRAASMTPPDSRPRRAPVPGAQPPRGRDCPNRVTKGRNPSTLHLLSRPTFYLLLLLLLLLALAGAAVWYFYLRPAPPPAQGTKHKAQSTIASVTPAPARTNRVEKVAEKPEKVRAKTAEEREEAARAERLKAFTTTNPPTMRGPKQRYEEALAKGSRRLFTHECDQWLAQYAIPGESSPPPPISADTKQSFVDSLTADPIVITDEDSPRDREIKEGVMALRDELKQWLKDGGDFEEYMRKLQMRQEQESFYVSEANQVVENAFSESGDVESTLALWRKINEKLVADGLRPSKLPSSVRVHFIKNNMEVPEQ